MDRYGIRAVLWSALNRTTTSFWWLPYIETFLLPPDAFSGLKKVTHLQLRLGLSPGPRWGSLQHSPRPSGWLEGRGGGLRPLNGWEGEKEGRKGKGRKMEGEGKGDCKRKRTDIHISCCMSTHIGDGRKGSSTTLQKIVSNHCHTQQLTTLPQTL